MKKLWVVFLPLALNIVIFRLILQTDLMMLGYFSAEQVVAYGAALKIMLIDTILALALAPWISTQIASTRNHPEHSISLSLNTTIFFGLTSTIAGLMIYPEMIALVLKDTDNPDTAIRSVVLLSFSILPRFLMLSLGMIFHGLRQGQTAIKIQGLNLALNIMLNLILAFSISMGPDGIYLSTFLSSLVCVALGLRILHSDLMLTQWSLPKMSEILAISAKITPEIFRIFAERLAPVLVIWVTVFSSVDIQSAYILMDEWILFLMFPLIALMRSISVVIAAEPDTESSLRKSFAKGILLTGLVLAPLLAFLTLNWGESVYGLNGQNLNFWKAFSVSLPFLLPALFAECVEKGFVFARQDYKILMKAELIASWGLFIPMSLIAIFTGYVELILVNAVLLSLSKIIYLRTFALPKPVLI